MFDDLVVIYDDVNSVHYDLYGTVVE